MDEDEFRKECLETGRIKPLNTATERKRYAEDFRELSKRELKGAKNLLGTDTETLVVGHAYKAMEFKANELLGWAGYRSKSHVCTQVALSKLLDRKELARPLSRAYQDRQAYDYTRDPGAMKAADTFEEVIEVAEEYIVSIEDAIKELESHG